MKLIDDPNNQVSNLFLDKKLLASYHWQYGVYSGPIVPTKLHWASSNSYHFALIGVGDLIYKDLVVIYPDKSFQTFKVSIIKLINADLYQSGDKNFVKLIFNNSWARTGPVPDQEKLISL